MQEKGAKLNYDIKMKGQQKNAEPEDAIIKQIQEFSWLSCVVTEGRKRDRNMNAHKNTQKDMRN